MTIFVGVTSKAEVAPNSPFAADVSVQTDATKISPYVSEGITSNAARTPLVIFDHGSLLSEGWCSFYLCHHDGGNFTTFGQWVVGEDGLAARQVFAIVQTTNSASPQPGYRRSSGFETGSLLATDPAVFAKGARERWDIHWKIADAGGIFQLYRNGSLTIDYSGDTLGNTSAGISRLMIGLPGATINYSVSGIIVADEDTRGMIYHQTLVNGNGSDQGLSGGFGAVDGVGIDDGDGLAFSAAGAKSGFTKAAIHSDFNSGYDVLAVCASARGKRGTTTGIGQRAFLSSNGDVVNGDSNILEPIYTHAHVCAVVDPDTGAAWTLAAANAAQVGVEIVAA